MHGISCFLDITVLFLFNPWTAKNSDSELLGIKFLVGQPFLFLSIFLRQLCVGTSSVLIPAPIPYVHPYIEITTVMYCTFFSPKLQLTR